MRWSTLRRWWPRFASKFVSWGSDIWLQMMPNLSMHYRKPGKPCSHLENMPMGMYSRCKQKYSYKRLLALHPTEKRTYPDAFKFPSCCSCYIKYLDDYLGRSNSRKVDINETGQGRDSRAMSPVNGSSAVVVESQPSDNSSISTIEILSSNPVEGTTIAASSNSTVASNTAKGELAVSQATVPQK